MTSLSELFIGLARASVCSQREEIVHDRVLLEDIYHNTKYISVYLCMWCNVFYGVCYSIFILLGLAIWSHLWRQLVSTLRGFLKWLPALWLVETVYQILFTQPNCIYNTCNSNSCILSILFLITTISSSACVCLSLPFSLFNPTKDLW